jgi:acetylcholinesterase
LIKESIIANFTPPVSSVTEAELDSAADRLLELYPDIPALGSPFNTVNDTFGLSPGFKRAAALGMILAIFFIAALMTYVVPRP